MKIRILSQRIVGRHFQNLLMVVIVGGGVMQTSISGGAEISNEALLTQIGKSYVDWVEETVLPNSENDST